MKKPSRMDYRKKLLLKRHRDAIVKDLDVIDVVDELLAKNVIPFSEIERLGTLLSREEKTRSLLNYLENSNDAAFQAFLDSLAKPYDWLWTLLSTDDSEAFNNSLEDSLSLGDVPRLPIHYVRRSEVEGNVASKLELLPRHEALVLWGTVGSGKTAIAASVLRSNPELVNNNFNGKVFWLNCSNCRNDNEAIILLQNRLLRQTTMWTSSYNITSSMSMSSISSIGDTTISSTDRFCSPEDMKYKLKVHFNNQMLTDALLVLDEVNDTKCVEAFDIGCRILITTRFKDVYKPIKADVVEVRNSLYENEILELFATCLGVNVNMLPKHAKKLQEACKGKSPFHLALIGAQLAENRESLIDGNNSLWKHYINNIEKKTFFSIFNNHEKPEKPEKVIKFCLESLDHQTFSLFKRLVILPDNVKVPAEVLSKLWHKSVEETKTIVRKLRDKSLINESYEKDPKRYDKDQRIYDLHQKSYLYETHEIILEYLHSCCTQDEIYKLHSDFLKSYNYDNPNTTTVDIVDDGYIGFYIGYHLVHTQNEENKLNMFHRLFLDLKFLGNKVRLTGQADVILDLQKYEEFIIKDRDHLDKEMLIAIVAFLKTYGTDLYRYPCTDIVQSILQHESKGVLYKKAYDIARANSIKNELYFDFSHEHNVEEIIPSTIDVKEAITACCFQFDYVLVGTELGNVKIFHLVSNKLKEEISVSKSSIKWIGACPIKPSKVAILSSDGDINLWTIKEGDTDTIEEECGSEDQPPSIHSCISVNPKMRPCINARWANNEPILIIHTPKTIILNDEEGQFKQRIETDRHDDILCCTLFRDRFIVTAVCNNGVYNVVLIDNITKAKVMTVEENDKVLDLLVVPGNDKIITLKSKEVTQHIFEINGSSYQNKFICTKDKVIATSDVKEKLSFLCMAVNKAGSLLFVSTCDQRVLAIDLNTNSRAFDIENRRGNVMSMDVSEIDFSTEDEFVPGMDVLLTGTGTVENSAKVWFLVASFVSHKRQQIDKARLTTRFDVSFANTLSPHTPHTPGTSTPDTNSNSSTPKRHQSFAERSEPLKKPALKSLSLDRYSLQPLNLKGACNNVDGLQPLLAVIDDCNNIQVMRGRNLLTKIVTSAVPKRHGTKDQVSVVKISPCNQHIIYGLESGNVNKFTFRTKETKLIMDLASPIQYLNFVNSSLLIASGENRCLMAYKMCNDGTWESKMLQRGSCHLGSQEMLNDFQGVKKKNGHTDSFSDTSISSLSLSDSSNVVDAFWIPDVGLITIEFSAVVKLWDQNLKLVSVLNAMHSKRDGVRASCAACHKNVLVICDGTNMTFQVFQIVKENENIRLNLKTRQKLSNAIVSCDLTSDGSKLALGMKSGTVEIWNILQRSRIAILKHNSEHRSEVMSCSFSPVPDRLYRTSVHSPGYNPTPPSFDGGAEEPPLVLVTMATEIVWWNLTYALKTMGRSLSRNINVLSPLLSPTIDNRNDVSVPVNNNKDGQANVFFGNGSLGSYDCWKSTWKHKKCKEGSKREDILACIKLSGINAKQLRHNEQFSCFVTVDNSGEVHIMNVMTAKT